MKRYTHDFDVLITTSFQSDIEDFQEALREWLKDFACDEDAKNAILQPERELSDIIESADPIGTYDNN